MFDGFSRKINALIQLMSTVCVDDVVDISMENSCWENAKGKLLRPDFLNQSKPINFGFHRYGNSLKNENTELFEVWLTKVSSLVDESFAHDFLIINPLPFV